MILSVIIRLLLLVLFVSLIILSFFAFFNVIVKFVKHHIIAKKLLIFAILGVSAALIIFLFLLKELGP